MVSLKPSTLRTRRRPRARRRGVAIVEAALTVSVLVVFWAATAMAYVGGRARLTSQWDARVATMYYATNGCKKAMDSGEGAPSAQNDGRISQASGDADTDSTLDNAPLNDSTEIRSTFFLASGSSTSTAELSRWSATKTSSSWSLCNETAQNGDPVGLLKYAGDLFKDLLPGPVQGIF